VVQRKAETTNEEMAARIIFRRREIATCDMKRGREGFEQGLNMTARACHSGRSEELCAIERFLLDESCFSS